MRKDLRGQPKDYQKQEAPTPSGRGDSERRWGRQGPSDGRWDHVCLPGRSWSRRGEAAAGWRCHLRQRDRDPGVSASSCPPTLCQTDPGTRGQEMGDRQTPWEQGTGGRPRKGANRELTGRED